MRGQTLLHPSNAYSIKSRAYLIPPPDTHLVTSGTCRHTACPPLATRSFAVTTRLSPPLHSLHCTLLVGSMCTLEPPTMSTTYLAARPRRPPRCQPSQHAARASPTHPQPSAPAPNHPRAWIGDQTREARHDNPWCCSCA